jgi:hypothetical protein
MFLSNKKICLVAKNTEISRKLIAELLKQNNSIVFIEDDYKIDSKMIVDKQNRITTINLKDISVLEYIAKCDVVISLLFLPYVESFNKINYKVKFTQKMFDFFEKNELLQNLIISLPVLTNTKTSYIYKKLSTVKNNLKTKVKNFCILETSIVLTKDNLYYNLQLLNKFTSQYPVNITDTKDLLKAILFLTDSLNFHTYSAKTVQVGSLNFIKTEDIKPFLIDLQNFNTKNNIDNFFITNSINKIKNYVKFYYYSKLFYILNNQANHNITLQDFNISTTSIKETLSICYNDYETSWHN